MKLSFPSLFNAFRSSTRTQRPARRSIPFRPRLEQLESREVMTASAISNLGGTVAQFNLLANGHLQQTVAGIQTDLGVVQGLFQGQDSTGHQVVFEQLGNSLNEFTPNLGWVGIGEADQVAQDNSGDVFFREAGTLLRATGVPTGGAAGWQIMNAFGTPSGGTHTDSVQTVVAWGNGVMILGTEGWLYSWMPGMIQPVYQGSGIQTLVGYGNGTGVLFQYQNGTLQRWDASQSQPVAITSVAVQSFALGSDGYAYMVSNNTAYRAMPSQAAPNTWTPITPPGVSSFTLGGDGNAYIFYQGTAYRCTASWAAPNTWTPMTPGGVSSFTLGGDGNAYIFYQGTAYRCTASWAAPNTWAPITPPGVSSFMVGSDGTACMVYQGIVYRCTASWAAPNTWAPMGQNAIVASDGSTWFLGTGTVDSAGDHAIYRLNNGQVTQMPGNASRMAIVGSNIWIFITTGFSYWDGIGHWQPIVQPGTGYSLQDTLNVVQQAVQDPSRPPVPGVDWNKVGQQLGQMMGGYTAGETSTSTAGSATDDAVDVIENTIAYALQQLPNNYASTASNFIANNGGATKAWFCSADFASWAGPATVGVEAVAAYLTDGESLLGAAGRLGGKVAAELKNFASWFAETYGGPEQSVQQVLAALGSHELILKPVEVNYSDGRHIGFGIVVADPSFGQSVVVQPGQIAISTNPPPVSVTPPTSGGSTVINTGPAPNTGTGDIGLSVG